MQAPDETDARADETPTPSTATPTTTTTTSDTLAAERNGSVSAVTVSRGGSYVVHETGKPAVNGDEDSSREQQHDKIEEEKEAGPSTPPEGPNPLNNGTVHQPGMSPVSGQEKEVVPLEKLPNGGDGSAQLVQHHEEHSSVEKEVVLEDRGGTDKEIVVVEPAPSDAAGNGESDTVQARASNAPDDPADGSPATRRIRPNQQRTLDQPTAVPSGRVWGNTRQLSYILNERDRLRYSWQSVHEEEPNRPRINIVKLFSNTTSASAGFPGGEALQFSISAGGRRIAAFNSARLYILQTSFLPTGRHQDYALRRRPLAVDLVDDGNTLAILVNSHTVNIYDLGVGALKLIRTLNLDFPTNCIALGRTGGILAAAYEGGIEIFSLAANALPTDRRAVRSQKMDRLAFSEDSSTLLGTTTRVNVSSTVIVSVPVFPAAADGVPTHEELKEAWCSELLQPENIRNSSHATYMLEGRATSNDKVFAWNGLADTFGLLDVSRLQYGNVDFPVVISPPLSTCGGLGAAIHSCPAIDEFGNTVAMIVNDRTIRLYLVPKAEDDETTVEAHSIDHELDEGYGNAFTDIRWVHSAAALPAPRDSEAQTQGRLIVTSPGGVMEPNTSMGLEMEEKFDEIEGGRIIIFDFDSQFVGQEGQTFKLTLGSATPQLLDEEENDVADEVALIRRRTVNQRKGGDIIHRPVVLGRSATTAGNRRGRGGSMRFNPGQQNQDVLSYLPDLVEDNETLDAFEQPYQPNAPRSQASLQRAATNVQRHRFQTLEERTREHIPVDAMGDAIPLPEYTEEPNAPLPSRYRAMAGLDQPAPPRMNEKEGSSSQAANQTAPAPQQQQNYQMPTTQPPDLPAAEGYGTHNSLYSDSYISPLQTHQQNSLLSPLNGVAPMTDPMSATSPVHSVLGGQASYEDLRTLPRSLQRAYSTDPRTGRVGSREPLVDNEAAGQMNPSPTTYTSPIDAYGNSSGQVLESEQLHDEVSRSQSVQRVRSYESHLNRQISTRNEQRVPDHLGGPRLAERSIWSPDTVSAEQQQQPRPATAAAAAPAYIPGAALLPGMRSPHDGFEHSAAVARKASATSSPTTRRYHSLDDAAAAGYDDDDDAEDDEDEYDDDNPPEPPPKTRVPTAGGITRKRNSVLSPNHPSHQNIMNNQNNSHSRRISTLAAPNKGAFASTAKARKLGFFSSSRVKAVGRKASLPAVLSYDSPELKRRKEQQGFRLSPRKTRGSGAGAGAGGEGGNGRRGEGRCVVM